MVIEEGSLPGAIARTLPASLSVASRLIGADTGRSFTEKVRAAWRRLVSAVGGPYRGAVRNTQVYLVMAHDDGEGRMYLDESRVKVTFRQWQAPSG